MMHSLKIGEQTAEVESSRDGEQTVVVVDGEELRLDSVEVGERYIVLRGTFGDGEAGTRRIPYAVTREGIHVSVDGHAYKVESVEDGEDGTGAAAGAMSPEVQSPMPGKILDVLVAVGDTVEPEQPLLRLEAMKMEQTVRAGGNAVVTEVCVAADDMVGPGQTLIRLEPVVEGEGADEGAE